MLENRGFLDRIWSSYLGRVVKYSQKYIERISQPIDLIWSNSSLEMWMEYREQWKNLFPDHRDLAISLSIYS